MGLIEDALRGAFEEQVRRAPAVDDPAGRAIAAGSRIRRRRTAVSMLAAVACVAMIGVGAALINSDRGRPPTSPIGPPELSFGPAERLPLAVLDNQRLLLPSWTAIPLDLPQPVRAWEVSDGWLVENWINDTAGLYLLPRGGGALAPIVSGDAVVVAPDGQRIAWSANGKVNVANRIGQELVERRETGGIGAKRPVRFVGQGLLLGGLTAGLAGEGYAMWFPDRGAFQAGADYQDPIFGATPDGSRLYALSGRNYPCLVTLDPEGLTRDRVACDLKLSYARLGVPSPDGRWLAITFSDRVEVYEVARLWVSAPPVQTFYTAAYSLAWIDGTSFVVSTGGGVTRYFADRPGPGQSIAIQAEPTSLGQVMPSVWPVPVFR